MKIFILTIGREIGLSATLRSEDETVGELRGSFLAHCVKIVTNMVKLIMKLTEET